MEKAKTPLLREMRKQGHQRHESLLASSSYQPTPHHKRLREPGYSTMNTCVLLLSCLDKLNQREKIAFAVFKPGSFVWPYRRDTVDGRERGQIVFFKDDPGYKRPPGNSLSGVSPNFSA